MFTLGAGPHPFAEWPRPLAFVLSGGGAFGSVQVGMLRALAEHGVMPDLVVGSSIGALQGAVVARHPDDAVELLTALWAGVGRRDVFGRRRDVAVSLVRTRTLSSFRHLDRFLDGALGGAGFGDLPIRFAAVATDALTGEPEILDHGDLKVALRASAAVPGVFPPVPVDGRVYVDGGVSANVPIRQAIALGAASVISLDATPPIVASAVPKGLTSGLLHTMSLMIRNQRSQSVDELAHRHRIAVLPSVTPPDMGSFNFARTGQLIDESHALTVATLGAWMSELSADHRG